MSHFSVLVIGDQIEAQLAPFHEFECTGCDDQYVQNVDMTKEVVEGFATATVTRLKNAVTGELAEQDDSRFYREPTVAEAEAIGPLDELGRRSATGRTPNYRAIDWQDGRGVRAKVHEIPAGWDEVEIPRSRVQNVVEYLEDSHGKKSVLEGTAPDLAGEHKYGYAIVRKIDRAIALEGEVDQACEYEVLSVIDRTNPNRKWDWWTVGGRWGGYFWLKPGATGVLGNPSVFDKIHGDSRNHAKVDQARKGDIDFEAMRAEAVAEAEKTYDAFAAAIEGHPWPKTWTEMREACEAEGKSIEDARKAYAEQPAVEAVNKAGVATFFGCVFEDYGQDRAAYVERCRQSAISTFAVVKDGQWMEKGEMGWFGMSTDTMTQDEWNRRFSEMLDQLPDDTLLTVVDCHI